jgi:hypothetical protein
MAAILIGVGQAAVIALLWLMITIELTHVSQSEPHHGQSSNESQARPRQEQSQALEGWRQGQMLR